PSDQNHSLVGLEAIHLDEQLIQRLLTLVMTAAQSSSTVTTNGVDFVDEDDARSMGFALLEQIAHSARADSDEHLDKIGSRHREKWSPGFTSDRARQQSLAGAGWSDEQRTLGQASAKLGELLRIFQ